MKITRRDLLAASAAGVLTATTSRRALAATKPLRLPNILWLVSEDNNPFIGAYGDKLARTPTIDKLAAEGVLFTNVYATAPVCAPSRFGIITGVNAESAGPAHHMRAEAKLPRYLAGFPQYLRASGYYCTNNSKTDYNCDLDPSVVWNDSSRKAHWRNRPEHAPFFAVFNYETTHESMQFFPPKPGAVKPDDVRVPDYLPDTPVVRQDIANYYNLVERMDGQLAARLAELQQDGLENDTIVFYYSDNGGVLPRSKRYCYEEGLRCALIVRVPEPFRAAVRVTPGSRVSSPVTFIDLAPTVLSLARTKIPSHMQGQPILGRRAASQRYAFGMRNRMDERYDFVRTVTDGEFRYIRNYFPHRVWGQYVGFEWNQKSYQEWEAQHREGKLNAGQDRFWQTKPFEEFYDVRADRDQLHNLIDAPEHRKRIAQMRKALDAHMRDINDNGFIPEGSAIEGYEQSRSKGAYPLRRVMALAEAAARRTPEARLRFEEALKDGNDIVRYWAAQGLLILGRESGASAPVLEAAMLRDTSPQVRIAAAEATAQFSKDERCIDVCSMALSIRGSRSKISTR